MKITILAKSSSLDPYELDFTVAKNLLLVFCNCQAGSFGKLCKHKTELISGDRSRLFSESEGPKLDQVQNLLGNASALKRISAEIAESDRNIKIEQAKLKKSKKRLEAMLQKGIEIDSD